MSILCAHPDGDVPALVDLAAVCFLALTPFGPKKPFVAYHEVYFGGNTLWSSVWFQFCSDSPSKSLKPSSFLKP